MVRFILRSLFLVLSVVILLIVSVGCNHTNDNISDDIRVFKAVKYNKIAALNSVDYLRGLLKK